MAEQSLADKLSEYEKLSSSEAAPEAGAGHYLKRGALQGISALADAVPNLYNLAKAAVGVGFSPALSAVTGKPQSTFLPEASAQASPIAQFLLENYGLNEPRTPSPSIGGKLGAAALEGAGAAMAQGPMGLPSALSEVPASLAAQAAKSAVLGAGAGAGGEIGSEATGGSRLGALAGSLLGGTVIPASFIGKGGVTVGSIRAAKEAAAEMKARGVQAGEPAFSNYVDSTLKGAAAGTTNAAENLTQGLSLRDKIPGFNPSVAEMSNSPGLLDMQRKFALLNPKNLNAETSRTEANAKAIQDFYRSKVPVAEAPGAVRSSVNQTIADYEKLIEDQARKVAGKLPAVDQMATGGKLAELAQAEKAAARPGITAAYQEAFDQAGNSKVPAAPIVAKVEEVLGEPLSQIKPANAPQTVMALRRIYGDKTSELTGRSIPPDLMEAAGVTGKKELTLPELHDIRVAINQDMAAAHRSMDPTAATRLYNLNKVLPEVNAAIDRLPPEASQAYKDATAKYATEFAPRFKEGANLRMFGDSSVNEPKILPDKTVAEYFKPDSQGGGTRAMQFAQLYGKNPEARDLFKQGILDIYRQKVVNPNTGAIDQSAHNTFMRDYGRTLQSFKTAGVDAASDIGSIGAQSAKISSHLSDISSLSKSLKFDTVDDMVSGALRDRKVMGNIAMRLPNDKRQTFNTLLLDKSMESGTAAGMKKFLDENSKTLAMTVPKEQLSAMNDIASALEMAERAPIRGNIAAGGADMLKNATGVSTATVFSQIRAVTGQRSSVEWAAINMAMPALNKMTQTSFANTMENALHSPESARALRNYLLAENPQQANKWAGYLLDGMKRGGKLVWDSRGPIAKSFLGPDKYPENLARTGAAIGSQMNQQQ